jgi:hypothetical protein
MTGLQWHAVIRNEEIKTSKSLEYRSIMVFSVRSSLLSNEQRKEEENFVKRFSAGTTLQKIPQRF